MSRDVRVLFSLTLTTVLLVRGAEASPIVYDNGAINGDIGGYSIASGLFEVSNSFTLTSLTTLVEAHVGLRVYPLNGSQNPPASVTWAIGTTQFGSEISSGTSAVSSYAYLFQKPTSNAPIDVFSTFFPLNGLLGPGAYWFTLTHTEATNGDQISWDINNGPSSAVNSYFGDVTNLLVTGTNSNAFTLYGDPVRAVPEPSTVVLLGAGLSWAARRRLRKRKP